MNRIDFRRLHGSRRLWQIDLQNLRRQNTDFFHCIIESAFDLGIQIIEERPAPDSDPWFSLDRRIKSLVISNRFQHDRNIVNASTKWTNMVQRRRQRKHSPRAHEAIGRLETNNRSEERRVGKECRYRWGADEHKKKKTR